MKQYHYICLFLTLVIFSYINILQLEMIVMSDSGVASSTDLLRISQNLERKLTHRDTQAFLKKLCRDKWLKENVRGIISSFYVCIVACSCPHPLLPSLALISQVSSLLGLASFWSCGPSCEKCLVMMWLTATSARTLRFRYIYTISIIIMYIVSQEVEYFSCMYFSRVRSVVMIPVEQNFIFIVQLSFSVAGI